MTKRKIPTLSDIVSEETQQSRGLPSIEELTG